MNVLWSAKNNNTLRLRLRLRQRQGQGQGQGQEGNNNDSSTYNTFHCDQLEIFLYNFTDDCKIRGHILNRL